MLLSCYCTGMPNLPPKKLLEEKLHNTLIEVRERLAGRRLLEGGDGK